jgi:predicted DNA binding CopG/RHH family protein
MPEQLVKTTLRIPAALFKAAKIRAVERGMTLQDVLAEALAAYLKKGAK